VGGRRSDLHLAIRSAADGVLAGTIDVQLHQDDLEPDQANLAFGLYPPWRGRGFATRAVALALEFLNSLGTVRSALIRVDPLNSPSSSVARRSGFVLAAVAADTADGLDCYERRVTSEERARASKPA
jgi:RimJ/RimL family protein N-acetyltransferase